MAQGQIVCGSVSSVEGSGSPRPGIGAAASVLLRWRWALQVPGLLPEPRCVEGRLVCFLWRDSFPCENKGEDGTRPLLRVHQAGVCGPLSRAARCPLSLLLTEAGAKGLMPSLSPSAVPFLDAKGE